MIAFPPRVRLSAPGLAPLCVLALTLLTGCASPATEPEPPVPALTESMYAKILSSIVETHTDAPEISVLTQASLEAIHEIDPQLTVDSDEGTTLLIVNDSDADRWDWPTNERPDLWATHAAAILHAARDRSDILQSTPDEDVFETVFGAMVDLLDRYSRYAGAEEARSNRESRQGFGGIGVTVVAHPLGVRG